MRVIGSHGPLPIDDPASLVDLELPDPTPGERDLLVRIEAVSVNPVDTKRRKSVRPEGGDAAVFGYDASGVVEAVGSAVTLFAPGDEVFYAGSSIRPGTNAELHLVDERLVGRKPRTLDHAEAAALPLTALTAWESLFEKLHLTAETEGDLLVVAGAGGVGSIAIQMAAKLTRLRVIATASRPETIDWVRELGAHEVVDHSGDVAAQLAELSPGGVRYVLSPHTPGRLPLYAEIMAPRGELVVIDEVTDDVSVFKPKSISLHWELMFTRSMFETEDMPRQGEILGRVSELVDAGELRTTLTESLSGLTAVNLREAHRRLESGRTIGKVVVTRV